MFWFKKEQKIITDPEKINEILTRGTEDILVKDNLERELSSGKQLRIKLGIDPTSPHIHLGRTVPLLKLRQFQDLGHKVVLIIGDFTAKIADPSDKLEKRPMLTDEEIKRNLKDYLKQIGFIIDLRKTEIHYNSEWLSSMDLIEIGQLMENFTVQQMSKRRNFSERLEKGEDVYLVEFMYPAMQGYDSVQIKSDVEIGGFDQLFNLKAGRVLQKRYGQKEQDIMTVSMLLGTDGRKMSSSWGNVISLLDSSDDMFGKIMSIKDDLIIDYFRLCTRIPLSEVTEIEKSLASGLNPKEAKIRLANEIVKMYHNEGLARKAEEKFNNVFSKGLIPEEILQVSVAKGLLLSDVFVVNELVVSKSDFRRLVSEGAITNLDNDTKVIDPNIQVVSGTYKIGKKRFIKINVI